MTERPATVEMQQLGNGQVLVALPDDYEGEVVLHCTGGTAHKFRFSGVGKPTGQNVHLVEEVRKG